MSFWKESFPLDPQCYLEFFMSYRHSNTMKRRERERLARRKAILDVARAVFLEKGG